MDEVDNPLPDGSGDGASVAVSRAIRRMTPLQREVFRALRFEDATYGELAQRHGITVRQVGDAFMQALLILDAAFDERTPWWRRAWVRARRWVRR